MSIVLGGTKTASQKNFNQRLSQPSVFLSLREVSLEVKRAGTSSFVQPHVQPKQADHNKGDDYHS
jgi:hypothetical protein